MYGAMLINGWFHLVFVQSILHERYYLTAHKVFTRALLVN